MRFDEISRVYGPLKFPVLIVFDQQLCKSIKKVINLIGFTLFSIALHFVFMFELVQCGNAKQCIWLEFAQRFYETDVLTSSSGFSYTHF